MGARGPLPKDDGTRARRNTSAAKTVLPAAGYQGPIPPWPLLEDLDLIADRKMARQKVKDLELFVDDEDLTPQKRARLDQKLATAKTVLLKIESRLAQQAGLEQGLWNELWRTPQAWMWAQAGMSQTGTVAAYVRAKVRGDLGELAWLREARSWSVLLGLTDAAMVRLGWVVASFPEERGRQRRGASSAVSQRYGGLKVVGTTKAGSDED